VGSGSLPRAAAGAALLLVLLLAGRAEGQQITESQKRLQEIRRERTELRQDLARLRTQVHDVSGELTNLARQKSASEGVVRELEFQLGATEQAIEETTRDLLDTQDRLAEKRALLHRRLRELYKRGPLATAQVLLAAESFGDLFNRYKYLSLVARRDRALVEEVTQLQSRLGVRRVQLQRTLADVQSLRQERLTEQSTMEELEGQQRRTLSALQTQEQSTSARITQLAEDERRLTTLIATLERRRREAEARAARERAERERAARASGAPAPRTPAPSRPTSTLSTAELGSLGWPVNGRVIYRFGPERQPNGTTIRWNGIGIAAPAGTAVIAVEAGEVVLAAPFEGYGPTVVLSHGGGYYSLYLYMSQLAVQEGAQVTRGQRLGGVGGHDTPEGPHLEFQIRSPGGQAVDPLTWLRNRGGR
jgi:septal ring factor EnvC (AmiA/AmiB activator)